MEVTPVAMDSTRLELSPVLFVPWGDGPAQFPLVTEEAYPAGLSMDRHSLKVAAPIWLREDDAGGLHLLAPATGHCLQFSAGGKTTGEVELGPHVLDYQPQSGGYAILRQGTTRSLEFRNLQGGLLWQRTFTSDDPVPQALFTTPVSVIVVHDGAQTKVRWHNLLDGSVLREKTLDFAAGDWSRMDPGHLGTIIYDEATRTRGLGLLALEDGTWEVHKLPGELYGALPTVFAGDGHGGAYLRLIPSLGGEYAWGHLGTKGEWICRTPMGQILPGKNGNLVLANLKENQLTLITYPHAQSLTVHLPSLPANETWHLTGLTDRGQVQLDAREQYAGWKRRLIVDRGGNSADGPAPQQGEVITRMQSPSTWRATSQGAYLLIGTADGLHVVRLKEN